MPMPVSWTDMRMATCSCLAPRDEPRYGDRTDRCGGSGISMVSKQSLTVPPAGVYCRPLLARFVRTWISRVLSHMI
jgi:hypothetical protein